MTVHRRIWPLALGAALFLGAAGWSPQAHALFDDDEARKAIIELRGRFDAHRQATDAALQRLLQESRDNPAASQRSLLELANQNEQLRAQMARLQGQIEELARQVSELQRAQKDVQAGVDARLRQVEPLSVSVDGREFTATPDEKRDYEAAMEQLRRAQFGPAALAYTTFSRRYPSSGYLPSVLYWMGNAHYANRAYDDAIAAHRRLAAEYPDHLRTPEALLAIANSQIELKDVKSARATLERLVKSHPQTEAAATARDRLTRLR